MTEDNGTLRVIYLEAENVKCLKAIRMNPDRTLVRIEGRNGQGKSTLLDLIPMILGGGKWQPDMPIRQGERKAYGRLDLGESVELGPSLVATRTWTASGRTYVEVKGKDGTVFSSPQKVLDQLHDDLTFDPLAFERMPPDQQNRILRQLAGLDFAELDAEREKLYTERTLVNHQAKSAASACGAPPVVPANTTPIDVAELAKEQQTSIEHNRKIEHDREGLEQLEVEIARCASEISKLEGHIDAYRTDKKLTEGRLRNAQPIELGGFAERIAHAQSLDKAIGVRERYDERKVEAKEHEDASEKLTRRIDAIDAEKRKALFNAKYPVDGLSVGVDGPTLNGIPFSQCSSREKLHTGVAIGLAKKPQARIVLMREASLLDNQSMIDLQEILEEFDAQAFVERVTESSEKPAVRIEDGEIVEATA